MKQRLFIISFLIVLMIGVIYIFGTALHQEKDPDISTSVYTEMTGSIPSERGVFKRANQAGAYQNMPESKRSLSTYYQNRAYPGAPPSIPHPLLSVKGIGGKSCLQCHQNGGFVQQFNAFAPVTPHPEMSNCSQCHLPKNTNQLFKPTNWEKTGPPAIKQSALVASPPIIPHTLNMRDNCLSCHAGPAAPKEIRVSHPERVNCRQCHLPKKEEAIIKAFDENQKVFSRDDFGYQENTDEVTDEQLSQISEWVKEKDPKN